MVALVALDAGFEYDAKSLSANLIHALELSWNILLRCVAGSVVLHAPSLIMMVS